MKNFDDILVVINGHIATITIQRPPNNFFDYLLIQQIADALVELDDHNECRVVILTSEGKNFCAGANFNQDKEMMGHNLNISQEISKPLINSIVSEIQRLNERVIEYSVGNVSSNVQQHMGYVDKLSKLPVPMDIPIGNLNKNNFTYDISNLL